MSGRAMTGMDQHPDIMELRARYERAAAAPLAQFADGLASAYGRTHGMAWVAPVIGIWAIITPWVIRGGIAGGVTTGTIASNVAVGAVAVVAGLTAMSVGTLPRR